MIILILATAGSAFMIVRLIHARQSATAHAPEPAINPVVAVESWGRMDDLQLTRLLRAAAAGE
jgi:uncharacterized SAM-binding protein YcdF (DUF218 family)